MRLFLASFLSPENRESYDSLVSKVVADVPDILRPVPAGTQHLTMVFIGDVAKNDVPACHEALESVRGFAAIRFDIGAPRILFARRSPRLVCVDLTSEIDRVSALQANLHEALSDRLPTPIARPKPPHVTLARFRKTAGREAARKVTDAFSTRTGPSVPHVDCVTRVQLVKSTLTPQGPLYETIGEAPCSDGGDGVKS